MIARKLPRKPTFWLYVASAVLLATGGWLFWNRLCTNPERVFWGMIEQSLATQAVTIQAEQTNDGTQLRQTMQYSLGAENLSHVVTNVLQEGTTIRNEVIGTPTADYTRYNSIQTTRTGEDGHELDFSQIIGVWSKTDDGMNQLFPQSVLGTALPLGGMVVPIGNFDAKKRNELVKRIQNDNAYQVAFKAVKKERKDGRLIYVYDVTIHPVAYAGIMKAFAAGVGLHQLDQLEPNTYQGQEPLKLQLSVDVRAQRLVKVAVPDGQYHQTYSAYGVPVKVELPKETISTTELQQRFSNL